MSKKPQKYKYKENSINSINFSSCGNNFNKCCTKNNNLKYINVSEIETEDKEMNNVESYGDKEYALCLKKALKEALDENQRVSKKYLININTIYR